MYGLSQENITKIINCIATPSNVEEAILFGSRAKGNYKEGSDIDICIKGEKLTLKDIYTIQDAYDETYLLYKLDIVIYHKITEPALVEHIERTGIKIYSKKENRNVA